MQKIRVFIVDDHDIVIFGVEALLNTVNDEIEVVGSAQNGRDAVSEALRLKPDVVIMDINIPLLSGIEAAKQILESDDSIKILFHTSLLEEDIVLNGFDAGCKGYIPKDFKAEELIEAIKTVYSGSIYMKGSVSDTFMKSYLLKKEHTQLVENIPLSNRELETLKLVCNGFSNKEIADNMNLSIKTVEVHKANIMKKLTLHSTAELVKYAIKNKLIEL